MNLSLAAPIIGPASEEAMDIVTRLCTEAGVPVDDAVIAQTPITNAVVLLPRAGLVGRVAHRSQHDRMRRELEAAAWFAGRGIPIGEPAPDPPCPQLTVAHGQVVTWWAYLGETERSSMPELCSMLRRIHRLPPPTGLLPRLDPFTGMDEQIEAGTRMPTADRRAMHAAVRVLSERWHASHWVSDLPTVVHGDAHWTNIRRTPDGLRVIDFEHAAVGAREWDLATCGAFLKLGWIGEEEFTQAMTAYGRDARATLDFDLLVQIRLLRMVTLVASVSDRAPHLTEQARGRFASLYDESLLTGPWWGEVHY